MVASENAVFRAVGPEPKSGRTKPKRPVPAGTLLCPWQRVPCLPVPADGAMHTCHKAILFYYKTLHERVPM